VSERTDSLWRHPDFRRLWAGQTASFLGSEVSHLALPLTAALTLDASAREMGLLATAGSSPALLVGLVVGALVDRLRRRPILILADLWRAALLASIPVASVVGWLSVPFLCVVAFLTGLLTTFFDVAQAALLPSLVRRDQLVDGNSRLEVSRSGAMIVGPGLAGLLIQALTAPLALLADAASFLFSALALARIRAPEPAPGHDRTGPTLLADVREGLRTVVGIPILRSMGASLCVFNLFAGLFGAVYLLFVTRELDLPPAAVGLVFALGSLGFPAGAVAAAWLAKRIGVGPAIVWGAGLSDAAFLLAPLAAGPVAIVVATLVLSRLVATLAGPVTAINQLSLRQAITPDRLQGRVNGTMRVFALGLAPLGALLGGALGDAIGLRSALLVGAVGLQFGFVILYFSPVREVKAA
jgi:MFS family permease